MNKAIAAIILIVLVVAILIGTLNKKSPVTAETPAQHTQSMLEAMSSTHFSAEDSRAQMEAQATLLLTCDQKRNDKTTTKQQAHICYETARYAGHECDHHDTNACASLGVINDYDMKNNPNYSDSVNEYIQHEKVAIVVKRRLIRVWKAYEPIAGAITAQFPTTNELVEFAQRAPYIASTLQVEIDLQKHKDDEEAAQQAQNKAALQKAMTPATKQ
jgi:hypothetical protein